MLFTTKIFRPVIRRGSKVIKREMISIIRRPMYQFSSQIDMDSDKDFHPKNKNQPQEEPTSEESEDLNIKEINLRGMDEEVQREKIKEAIQNETYLLFMKGTPSQPMCGYSRFAVEILKFYEIPELSFVNVLSQDNLRPMIKEITEWETFPQLFVRNEQIGGSDVIMELHKDDLLREILFKEQQII